MNVENPPANSLVGFRILWGAFMSSFGFFVLVAFFATQDQEPAPEQIMQIGPILSLMALSIIGLVPLIRARVTGVQVLPLLMEAPGPGAWDDGMDEDASEETLAQAHAKFNTGLVVGLAMTDSIVIFGLVMAFMARMPIVILPFAGAGLVVAAWQFPTLQSIHAVARSLRAARV